MNTAFKIILKVTIYLSFRSKVDSIQVPVRYQNGTEILEVLAEDLITDQTVKNEHYNRPIPTTFSTPEECARRCTSTRPKTCYYRFHVEQYITLSRACEICRFNRTNNCQCILADGIQRIVYTINRRLPGPNIEVCENDKVIIDVENEMEASDLTIHWHGIHQAGTQYYDGVPYVTQCPISHKNTFRYEWVATPPGTHFYHSHTGFQKMDGISGGIVIRQEPKKDPNSELYDYDESEHVIVLLDWIHELSNIILQTPLNILINGKGKFNPVSGVPTDSPLEEFTVQSGYRYRFRIINALAMTCAIQLTVQDHTLTVIAADGAPVQPVIVNSIISFSAERYDVIISANQPIGHYWIQVIGLGVCEQNKVQQLAVLKYVSSNGNSNVPPTYDSPLPIGKVLNPIDGNCEKLRTDAVCVNQLKNALNVNPKLLKTNADVKIFLPIREQAYTNSEAFNPNHYTKFFIVGGGFPVVSLIDNISYVSPAYPLISQYWQNSPSEFCDGNYPLNNNETVRKCTHIIKVPMNRVVELVFVDEIQIADLGHPLHLHGYTFNVLSIGRLPDPTQRISLDKTIHLDRIHQIQRNFNLPPGKDTIIVPANGYTVIRFISNNPGFWLVHCHFVHHLVTGMAAVIQVGSIANLPLIPLHFPKCGNFN